MRIGICLLPEHPWSQAEPLWREAETMGFDHAWTYDHLVWGGLRESPWYGTTPTLTAAAIVTSRIGLGTFVTSPNFRHPVTLMRDLLALDDISGGRLIVGIGSGGEPDATILGGDPLTPREKVDRLAEFTDLLDRTLTQDHVDYAGRWFSCRDARTLPGPVPREGQDEGQDDGQGQTSGQRRMPFVIAANGPRAMRIAARHGQGWVTTGPPGTGGDDWWAGVAALTRRFEEVLAHAAVARPPQRYLNLDAGGYAMTSLAAFTDAVGRARDLGFTDVVTHWPRPQDPYAGRRDVLEEVAAALPQLRA